MVDEVVRFALFDDLARLCCSIGARVLYEWVVWALGGIGFSDRVVLGCV